MSLSSSELPLGEAQRGSGGLDSSHQGVWTQQRVLGWRAPPRAVSPGAGGSWVPQAFQAAPGEATGAALTQFPRPVTLPAFPAQGLGHQELAILKSKLSVPWGRWVRVGRGTTEASSQSGLRGSGDRGFTTMYLQVTLSGK